jgi:hypothetical protein
MVTLLARTVMLPVMSRFSITAPSVVTAMKPLVVSDVPDGTPVLVAFGGGRQW